MYSKTEINATAIRAVLHELSKQASWGPLAGGENLNAKLKELKKKHSEVLDYFELVDDPRFPGTHNPYKQPSVFKFVENKEISEDKLHNFIIDFSNALIETKNKANILMYICFSNKYTLNPIFKDEKKNYMELVSVQDNENIEILNSIKTFSEDQLGPRKEQGSNTSLFFNENTTNTTDANINDDDPKCSMQ